MSVEHLPRSCGVYAEAYVSEIAWPERTSCAVRTTLFAELSTQRQDTGPSPPPMRMMSTWMGEAPDLERLSLTYQNDHM